MEKKDPLAAPIAAHLKAGTIDGKWIGPHHPSLGRNRRRSVQAMIAIIQHDVKMPIGREWGFRANLRPIGKIWLKVAVEDVFQIALIAAAKRAAVGLVRRRE